MILKKFRNNQGITIIEALIATFLTAVAVISLMPMEDMSLRTSFRADYLGRAQEIMQQQLEATEHAIATGNPVTIGVFPNPNITVSGLPVAQGDATFNATTTIAQHPTMANLFTVNVRVTWTNGPAAGISSTIVAGQLVGFGNPNLGGGIGP